MLATIGDVLVSCADTHKNYQTSFLNSLQSNWCSIILELKMNSYYCDKAFNINLMLQMQYNSIAYLISFMNALKVFECEYGKC